MSALGRIGKVGCLNSHAPKLPRLGAAAVFVSARDAAMPRRVGPVLFCGRPAQIVGTVVFAVPIPMGGVAALRRRRAMESFANQRMDSQGKMLALHPEIDARVRISARAGRLENLQPPPALIGNGAPNPAKTGNLIVGRLRDCAPFLIWIFRVSHDALLSHCGQGRALFRQRFRPAFYGRISGLSQAFQWGGLQ